MSSLTDLSRPYVGEYICEELRFGEEDLLGGFEYVRLTLGPDGDAQLTWRTVDGGEGATALQYEMREGSITLSRAGRMGAYTFPVSRARSSSRTTWSGACSMPDSACDHMSGMFSFLHNVRVFSSHTET